LKQINALENFSSAFFMNECPDCGASREWKTNLDATKFLLHPLGGCHAYIQSKLKNRCNLFKQDFRTPKICLQGCKSRVYCFETQIGTVRNKIYLDTPRPPWIKHDCETSQGSVDQTNVYQPLVFIEYISCQAKQRLLGFLVQIASDEEALLLVGKPEENAQFIRQIHQPFFYEKIDDRNWILNTYQENHNAIENSLYAPKEYTCHIIMDPTRIKGWKKAFGDNNQLLIDL
jgi:hypothetical protein